MEHAGDTPWRPAPVEVVHRLLAPLPVRWWFSGGVALELHLGRSWRAHDDIDVGICRADSRQVLDHVRRQGWETTVAAGGQLRPWAGAELRADANENNVWCRRPGGPWELDVTVGDGDRDEWIYRRDPTLRRPWSRAVLHTEAGLPYLAPELQLLFKSAHVRPKDTIDAQEVIRTLAQGALALLQVRLAPAHPWAELVARHRQPLGEHEASDIYTVLDDHGIESWVDGGWAVDALLGHQTRDHADLDLAVHTAQFGPARSVLAGASFALVRDDGPHNVVLTDDAGRLVDLHSFDHEHVIEGSDGRLRFGGDGLAYEVDGFSGIGQLAGRPVRCIEPATLVRYHSGYPIDDGDRHDVALLCERFNLEVPEEYRT